MFVFAGSGTVLMDPAYLKNADPQHYSRDSDPDGVDPDPTVKNTVSVFDPRQKYCSDPKRE